MKNPKKQNINLDFKAPIHFDMRRLRFTKPKHRFKLNLATPLTLITGFVSGLATSVYFADYQFLKQRQEISTSFIADAAAKVMDSVVNISVETGIYIA